MSNELLQSLVGHGVRTMWLDGEQWWCLKDITDSLNLSNSRAVGSRLPEKNKKHVVKNMTPGSGLDPIDIPNRGMSFINEAGVYTMAMRSEAPAAREFVTKVARDMVNRTGAFQNVGTISTEGEEHGKHR